MSNLFPWLTGKPYGAKMHNEPARSQVQVLLHQRSLQINHSGIFLYEILFLQAVRWVGSKWATAAPEATRSSGGKCEQAPLSFEALQKRKKLVFWFIIRGEWRRQVGNVAAGPGGGRRERLCSQGYQHPWFAIVSKPHRLSSPQKQSTTQTLHSASGFP